MVGNPDLHVPGLVGDPDLADVVVGGVEVGVGDMVGGGFVAGVVPVPDPDLLAVSGDGPVLVNPPVLVSEVLGEVVHVGGVVGSADDVGVQLVAEVLAVVTGDVGDVSVVHMDLVGVGLVFVEIAEAGVDAPEDFAVLGVEPSVGSDVSAVDTLVVPVPGGGVFVDAGDTETVVSVGSSDVGQSEGVESVKGSVVGDSEAGLSGGVHSDEVSSPGVVGPDDFGPVDGVGSEDGGVSLPVEGLLGSPPSGELGEVPVSGDEEASEGAHVLGVEAPEGRSVGDSEFLGGDVVPGDVQVDGSPVGGVDPADVQVPEPDGAPDGLGPPDVDVVGVPHEVPGVDLEGGDGGSVESQSVGAGLEHGAPHLGEPVPELEGVALEGAGGPADLAPESGDVDAVVGGPLLDISEDLGSVALVLNGQGVGDALDVVHELGVLGPDPAVPPHGEDGDGPLVPGGGGGPEGVPPLEGEAESVGVGGSDLSEGGGLGLEDGGSEAQVASLSGPPDEVVAGDGVLDAQSVGGVVGSPDAGPLGPGGVDGLSEDNGVVAAGVGQEVSQLGEVQVPEADLVL